MRPPEAVALFDAHVHVYPWADVAVLLDAAWRHFETAATALGAPEWDGILLLTETANDRWFDRVAQSSDGMSFGRWHVAPVHTDPLSLNASRDGRSIRIVAGRQIVTKERLEVHALGTRAEIADGVSLDVTLEQVQDAGALPVLPWGVGKWTGRRRSMVKSTLAAAGGEVLVSDNSGRPWFWQEPLLLQQREAGRVVLRGSDALPINGDERRTGRFGCRLNGACGGTFAAASFLARVRNTRAEDVHEYGAAESTWPFLRNQTVLRLRRRDNRPPLAPGVTRSP